MTIEEAKSIRIADYLHSLGYSPVKQQGINLWYKSPFREESEASFKVNTEREQWYDFGLGKGGNIIALAAHLYATDHVPYILKRIAEQTPHVRPISFSFGKQSSSEPSFQHLEIVPLSSPGFTTVLITSANTLSFVSTLTLPSTISASLISGSSSTSRMISDTSCSEIFFES